MRAHTFLLMLFLSPWQAQVKDTNRELEDARTSHKEVTSDARESERKARTMEAEILYLQEVEQPFRICTKI